jgi:hypothetical protein
MRWLVREDAFATCVMEAYTEAIQATSAKAAEAMAETGSGSPPTVPQSVRTSTNANKKRRASMGQGTGPQSLIMRFVDDFHLQAMKTDAMRHLTNSVDRHESFSKWKVFVCIQ